MKLDLGYVHAASLCVLSSSGKQTGASPAQAGHSKNSRVARDSTGGNFSTYLGGQPEGPGSFVLRWLAQAATHAIPCYTAIISMVAQAGLAHLSSRAGKYTSATV